MSARPAAAQLGHLPPVAQAALEAIVEPLAIGEAPGPALPGVRVLVTPTWLGMPKVVLDRLPDLALIAVFGVGLDRIDFDYAGAHGITVTNTPGVLTDDVADFAILLLLAAARRLVEGDRFVRAGLWAEGPLPLGRSLRGKTIGVVGFGRIGQAVAERAAAFGINVRYWSRTEKAGTNAVFEPDLSALAAASAALIITVAASPETERLIDRPVLRALGAEGILVNVARGSVVDEDAVAELLERGELGFAALDVFAAEPHPAPGLLGHKRTILEPHQASATHETREAMGGVVVESVAAFLAGRRPAAAVLSTI